jgi:uncharacterized protein (TIGR01319 family)
LRNFLLIDFGSTYTKLTAIDLDGRRVLGTSRALTTVSEGIQKGLVEAEKALFTEIGKLSFQSKLACSSAAGGLKMVAVGLVPELTVAAARQAALGAGARVVGTFGFRLDDEAILRIIEMVPDLLILSGGTDGGDRETILHNGRMLAESALQAPVIVAGNQAVTPELVANLQAAGKIAYHVPNVLPEPGRMNIEPVQAEIRRIFLERIIHAKGLDQVLSEIDGIMMPTPAAVLQATQRLADGSGEERGLGELMVVDVGGATTDVHTAASGFPSELEVLWRGLRDPFLKRSVEGDLGMRYSAGALVEAFGLEYVAKQAGLTEEQVRQAARRRRAEVGMLPAVKAESDFDGVLGFLAIQGATDRHVGQLETHSSPFGTTYIQTGKDLSNLPAVIGTGGVIVHYPNPAELLRGALFNPGRPEKLKPKKPKLFLDQHYLLPTLGLIAEEHPEAAYQMLRGALSEVFRVTR